MTEPHAPTLTLTELSEQADVTPRTVRYYIHQGLLPPPGGGPKARYDERHIKLLRLVKELQRQHLPLAEIRTRLEGMDDEGIDRLLASPSPAQTGSAVDYIRRVLENQPARYTFQSPSEAPARPSPKPMARSQWERLALSPDIELHIRRPLSRHHNRQVERIVAFARQLLEEDTP